ncbi:unnamed protein product [Caenorhabditis sp. 36 PRJEB53466]|nr:unnamed protein product [Caenorhabditis sp. 36 PRJEB53466]
MDFARMMSAASKNAKKADREVDRIQEEVNNEKNDAKRQLEAEKRARQEMQRRKAEKEREMARKREERQEEERRRNFTIPKRGDGASSSTSSGVNTAAVRAVLERQKAEKEEKDKKMDAEKQRLMMLRMQANGGKATKKMGKQFGMDVMSLQTRFGGNNEHLEVLQKRKWKEEEEADMEADKYRSGVFKAMAAKQKNEGQLRNGVNGPHRMATSKSNSLAGLCSRHERTRDTFSPPKDGKKSTQDRREPVVEKKKIQAAAPIDFKSLMAAASSIAEGKSVNLDHLQTKPAKFQISQQKNASSNGQKQGLSAVEREKLREKERIREKQERQREMEKQRQKEKEKERARASASSKSRPSDSKTTSSAANGKSSEEKKEKPPVRKPFQKGPTPPPVIPAAVPGKKYLPGDVRYKQAMAMAKNGGGSSQSTDRDHRNAPSSSSSLSSGAVGGREGSSQNNKDRISAVREAERQREKDREKQKALKRAREEKSLKDYEREKRMRKLGPSSSSGGPSSSSTSSSKNSADAKRNYEMRRMAELREQQVREKERKKTKKSNGDRRADNGTFWKGADDFTDEEMDEDEYDNEDFDDDDDMDDFIDDTEVDMDNMSRKDFEETLRMVNRKYDTDKWSRREKMISERDMISDYRRVQAEENYSKRAGFMEDLKEATKGRSTGFLSTARGAQTTRECGGTKSREQAGVNRAASPVERTCITNKPRLSSILEPKTCWGNIVGSQKSRPSFPKNAFVHVNGMCLFHVIFARNPGGPSSGGWRMTKGPAVWCEGSLLHAVQLSGLFPDCKTFVDMPLKHNAETTLAKWNALVALTPITNDVLALFLRENFDEPEGELEECAPDDWLPLTGRFGDIIDEDYRKFAAALHAKWPTLYRKISQKVRVNPEKYSIIAVPHPFVVPGGRFREMYYWDSFFTIKGLLASGMLTTVKGMIDNMVFLVETYGFIPNGTRIYYLNRSQPPLLTWCVKAYYEATKDKEFLRTTLPTLRKELSFFQKHKSVRVPEWNSPLFRFVVETDRPRPESYREDLESAEHLDTFEKKCVLWGDLAAAAESGRDFSSRFFAVHGPYAGKLEGTRTSQLVPVDLNSIICGNLKTLSRMYAELGDVDSAGVYEQQHQVLKETIKQVLWSEEHGCWFDYDLEEGKHAISFHDTNFFPMYTGSFHEDLDSKRVVDYITSTGAAGFSGGIPVSLSNTGEQWDFPNCWPPTTYVLLEGLRKVGQEELALNLVEKWVQKNYNMWRNSGGRMFEKYNAVSPCYKVKGGGEYVMQEGFGWTNGVILEFLRKYGSQIRWRAAESCECCDVNVSRSHVAKSASPVPSSNSTACLFASDSLTQTPSVLSLQSMASDLSTGQN